MTQKITLTLVLLFTATFAHAQRTASASGSWSDPLTWGGSNVPTSADAVTINSGIIVTVDANAAAASITFPSGNTANSSLSINSGVSLTVAGSVTIPRAGSTGGTDYMNTLAVGTGTLNAASISFTSGGTTSRHQMTISTGTANISGNISTNTGTSAVVSFSGAGLLQVGGSLFATNGTLTAGTGTVEFDGSGAQSVRGFTYNNLKLSNAGVKTLAGTVAGTLTISGSATTAGTIAYGTNGILKYNGSAAQTTSNVEFPTSMSGDVVIDNAAGVSLNSAKTLNGSLTLTNGVLTTSATNLLSFADNFTTISGGSASSYINGPVRKTGNDAFTFPVGKSGVYAPVTITAPDNTADAFTVEYFRGTASLTATIDAAISSNVARASGCEYWNITEGNDAGTPTSISVTVAWSTGSGCGSTSYITDVTKLTLLHYNTTTNKWDSYGGTASGTTNNGTIIRTAVSAFSPFTLGSLSSAANPLPVNFADVKAFEKGAGVQIDWTNATESDMSAYLIERSADGINFSVIGQTAPRSNQLDKVSYTYMDAAPLAGTNFYRIKATELSGKNVYSKSLRVDIGRSPKGISLYPNPVRGSELNIGFTAQKGQYSLNVLNTAGQIVYRQSLNHAGGTVAQIVSLPASLKAGVYSVLISGNNYKETKMFVIQ